MPPSKRRFIYQLPLRKGDYVIGAETCADGVIWGTKQRRRFLLRNPWTTKPSKRVTELGPDHVE